MSCDNLRFLSCLAHLIFQKDIQYAIDIINVLNQCLVKLINTKPTILNEDYEKVQSLKHLITRSNITNDPINKSRQ